ILATDTRLNRKVAIKRIIGKAARSKTAVQRFLTEAQSMAELSHTNIVQIYDYGRATDGPFLIMECVQGGSLLEKCKAGPIELDEAVNIFSQLCDGLAKAHAAGIIHRDIKPANVLMTEDGVPKLTDFGLAKDDTADTGMTMEGAVIGTLDFMPPEQRQAAELTDHRSDLWSLAATFYQMLTGKSPKIIKFSNVPTQLQDALGKALEDEKEDRFQSALEMKDAVQQAAGDLGPGEFPLTEIPDDFRQQVRQLFTEKYIQEFKGFDKLHAFPDLPGSKLANVLKTYAEGVSTNDMLLLFDNTLLGSANDGFLMTDQAIYWHNANGPFKTLELTALDHVMCEKSMMLSEIYLNYTECIKTNRLKPVETVTAMLKEIVSIKSGGLDRQGITDGPEQIGAAEATPDSAAVTEKPVNKGLLEMTEELARDPKQEPRLDPEQNVAAEATTASAAVTEKPVNKALPEMTEELAREPKQESSDGPEQNVAAEATPISAAIVEEPVQKGFREKMKELGGGLKRGVERIERFSDATPGLHKLPSLGDPTGRTRQEIEGILGPTTSLSESPDGYSAKWTSLLSGQLTVMFDNDDVCQGITDHKKAL
ncbi:MAG: serine/threonine protein kinase, partial [Dehalococcoidia bacterium]|nr:serine/threonine protein kinase [Dehalococcoidia bacterium]